MHSVVQQLYRSRRAEWCKLLYKFRKAQRCIAAISGRGSIALYSCYIVVYSWYKRLEKYRGAERYTAAIHNQDTSAMYSCHRRLSKHSSVSLIIRRRGGGRIAVYSFYTQPQNHTGVQLPCMIGVQLLYNLRTVLILHTELAVYGPVYTYRQLFRTTVYRRRYSASPYGA